MRLVTPRGRRRIDRYTRTMRAMWRDTSALWQEFRRPVLVFLAATVIGGWVYGELLVAAGYPRLPFVNLPYAMVSLMILNPVIELPSEAHLVIFWYVMPMLGIYVVGSGATNFVRLFFDRAERRNAWEEAVVSTYRNHIIVMGIGHIGLRVLRALADMNIEVVAIDLKRDERLESALTQLRVPLIVGDARHRAILEQAGLSYARALIVCTSEDFLNLEICVRAREINPTARIVVRMWDNEFASHLKHSLNVQAISSSDLAAPAFAGTAMGVDVAPTFNIHDKDYSLIRLEVAAESQLPGKTIDEIQLEHDIDIVLHERDSKVDVHPPGDLVVQTGDNLVIFTLHLKIPAILALNTK